MAKTDWYAPDHKLKNDLRKSLTERYPEYGIARIGSIRELDGGYEVQVHFTDGGFHNKIVTTRQLDYAY